MRTDTPDVRRAADRRRRADRRADLLPRPAARPRRPGPDRPALLMKPQGPHHTRDRHRRVHAPARPRLPARDHRGRAGRVPRPGRRVADRARRRAGRLAPDRRARTIGGKPDPAYFQPRPSATGYSATATFFANRGPNQAVGAVLLPRQLAAYLALEGPYNPGLTNARVPVDAVTTSGVGRRPAHLAGQRARSRRAASRATRGIALARVAAARSTRTPTAASSA